jgi:DHA1 family arabinose polymer transporter-like MFS transporter
MIGGMTIANLVGVPGGTWLGHHFSWRYTFALIAVFNVAVLMAIFCWVPTLYDRASTGCASSSVFWPGAVADFRRHHVW